MNKNNSKWIEIVVLSSYTLSILIPSPAFAVEFNHGFADENAGKYSTKCVNGNCDACKDFCSMFTTSPSGNTTWQVPQDDTLCESLGSPTAGGRVRPPAAPTPVPSYGSCNINISSDILSLLSGKGGFPTPAPSSPSSAQLQNACNQASRMKDRCTFHNSQVETQCIAMSAMDDSGSKDVALGSFEAVVALTCAGACYTAFTPDPTLQTMCITLGTTASITELAMTMQMANGQASQYVSKAFGAAALTTGVMSGGAQLFSKAATGKAATKAACVSMILFGVLSGLRIANGARVDGLKSQACNDINDLLGSFNPTTTNTTGRASAGGPNNPGSNNNAGTAGGGGGGGGSNGNGAGAGGGGGDGSSGSAPNPTVSCLESNDPSSPACQAAISGNTPEETALRSTPGLFEAVMKNPKSLEVAKAIQSGQSPGAAIAGALGSSAGPVGPKLGELADIAAKDDSLRSIVGDSSAATSSGGGGGGGAGGAGGAGNNGSVPFVPYTGGTGTMGAKTPSQADYTHHESQNDIWHSNTHMNLFEIVSDKIGKVSPRIK